jgi:hypothetical protein
MHQSISNKPSLYTIDSDHGDERKQPAVKEEKVARVVPKI